MRGSASIARAKQITWRWPSDSARPLLPHLGREAAAAARRSAPATSSARAAARTSSSVASGRPTRMLSSTRAREEEVVLRDAGDAAGAATSPVTPARSRPSIRMRPAGRQVELGDQVDERALAAAGGPDQRDGLCRRATASEISLQHRAPGLVGEADAAQLDPRPSTRRSAAARPARPPSRGGVSSSANTRSAPAIAVSAWLYWLPRLGIAAKKRVRQEQELDQRRQRHAAAQRLVAADHQHAPTGTAGRSSSSSGWKIAPWRAAPML